MQFVKHAQAVAAILALGKTDTPLILGPIGIGKTALFYELKRQLMPQGYHVVEPIDCTQLSDGSITLPALDMEHGVSRELPNVRMGVSDTNHYGTNDARPVLLCFDEFTKAPKYVQNMVAPIINDHRLGDYRLPQGSITFCTGNMGIEGYGDAMQAYIKNRLIPLYLQPPTAQEWIDNYARPNRLNATMQAYVGSDKFNGYLCFETFLDYEAGGAKHGANLAKDNPRIFNPRAQQEAFATPRSMARAARVLDAYEQRLIDTTTLDRLLDGTVGHVVRAELSEVIRFGSDNPSLNDVYGDPEYAHLSSNPMGQMIMARKLAGAQDSRAQVLAAVNYVSRMRGEMQHLYVSETCGGPTAAHALTVQEFNDLSRQHAVKY